MTRPTTAMTFAFAFVAVQVGTSLGCNAILGNGYGADDTAADGSGGGNPVVEGGAGGDASDGGTGVDGMTTGDGSTLDGDVDAASCPRGVCAKQLTDAVGPQRLALSATGVYWASLAGIGRVNLDGSNPKIMLITQAVGANLKRGISVAPDGLSAYVTMPGGGKGAAKCAADLSSCGAGFIGSAGLASSIASDATKVYVGIFDDQLAAAAGGIWQTAPDGTSALPYTMMLDKVLDLQIVGATTYFRTAKAINANTRTTMPTTAMTISASEDTLGFVVVGTKLFVATASKHIQTCTLSLPTPCTGSVVQITAENPSAITSDGTYVYWVERDAGTVNRCDVANCSTTRLTLATGQTAPNDIVVDATFVYWANYGDVAGAGGAVMKLPK